MAPMKRERQWDMFDVAIGACELDDYLNQRYQESDLQSKFWVEKEDRVDELRPPAPGTKEQVLIPVQGPGVTPPAPPQQVSAEPLPSRPPWEAQVDEAPLPSRPPWEAPSASEPRHETAPVQVTPPPAQTPSPVTPPPRVEVPATAVEPPPIPVPPPPVVETTQVSPPPEAVASAAPLPPNMAELLARFHQATQAYEERTKGVLEELSGEEPEES